MTNKSQTPTEIEIFRAGTHVAMSGQELSFSKADLAACASSYDPSFHEAPIVIGHPKHDGPAYGWVKGLVVEGDVLKAKIDQVNPEFADLVGKGAYKKISSAFYPPNAKNNPKPGVWTLRHVGFLGAHPPSVKGLKQAEFADDPEVVEFADLNPVASAVRSVIGCVRKVREFILEKYGSEAADKVASTWELDWALEQTLEQNRAAFSETNQESIGMTEKDTADEAARKAALDEREKNVKAQEAAFAEKAAAAKTAGIVAYVDGLVKAAKLPAGEKAGLAAFMEGLDADEAVAFGEGQTLTRLDYFKGMLKRMPKMVEFGEVAGGDTGTASVEFAAPAGAVVDMESMEIHAKAVAYQQAHPETSYIAAVKASGGK